MQKMFVVLFSFMIIVISSNAYSEEKDTPSLMDFHLMAGLNINQRIGMNSVDSIGGMGAFIGVGYSSFALLLEISGEDFERDASAESVYGDIGYKQEFEEGAYSLHLRYYLFKNRNIAPFVGGFGSVPFLDQFDEIKDDYADKDNSILAYGVSAGIVIFPAKLFNVYLETRYIRYTGSFETYGLRSQGMTGEWDVVDGNKIDISSFYIAGGVSCSIF